MTREYLASKEIICESDFYKGYRVLNLYRRKDIFERQGTSVLYGIFLSRLSSRQGKLGRDEIHLPVLFRKKEEVEKVFRKLNNQAEIEDFTDSLDHIVLEGRGI